MSNSTSTGGSSSTLMILMVFNLIGVLAVIAILLNRQTDPGMRGAGMNKETMVIDRVGNFVLSETGRVNMDLISLQNNTPTTGQKLSIPQQGFLKCYSDMGQLMKIMIDRGLIEATATGTTEEDGPG